MKLKYFKSELDIFLMCVRRFTPKLYLFKVMCKLLKVKEGEYAPEWLSWLFFPLKKYALRMACFQYDFNSRVYTLNGRKVSEQVIQFLYSDIPEGTYFKIIKRKPDGMPLIEQCHEITREVWKNEFGLK